MGFGRKGRDRENGVELDRVGFGRKGLDRREVAMERLRPTGRFDCWLARFSFFSRAVGSV